MSVFPKSEGEVWELAQQMAAGYTAHAEYFPSMTPELLGELQGAIASYEGVKTDQDEAKAAAKTATANKEEVVGLLVDKMRNALKLSEVDCSADPQLLDYIGWGPRDLPNEQVAPPAQPETLKITAEGSTDIWLAWEQRGKANVRHWVVERRQQVTHGGDYSEWAFAGTSLNTEIHLEGQPSGVKLEYRVRAENNVAFSDPSNSVFAVL